MNKNLLAIHETGTRMPDTGPVQCMSAYFVQKPMTIYNLLSGTMTPNLKVYPNEAARPSWDADQIAVNALHIVENGIDTVDRTTPLNSPLSYRHNDRLKRVMDIAISGFLLVTLFSWIFPIISILIKTDSAGPVFFRQKRHKKGGKIFQCIKFRTMILNPEADSTATFDDDPRVTRTGLFLRRYHLDELPQLLNVLKGDMSIVGPRPHMIAENIRYRTFLENYNSRHQVKPGITGLAQSMGYHGSTSKFYQINGRLRLDKMYIQQWSVALDIRILLQTVRMLLRK